MYHLPIKHLTTMIIGWHGIVLSYTFPKPNLGFSISKTLVQTPFLSGSTTGGHGLDATLQFFQLKLKKVRISGRRISLPLNPTQKKFNFFEPSTSHGFSVGNTDYKTICSIHSHCLWFVFTKLNGGMSTKPNYVAKKMWSIFARQKQRSSHSTTSIHLKRRRKLLLALLPQSKGIVQ